MPIAAAAMILSAAVPAITSYVQGRSQASEIRRLQKQGPAKLSPALQEALARTRVQANATYSPSAVQEQALIDQGAADSVATLKRSSGNASDVLSGLANVGAQRGAAVQRLAARNVEVSDRNKQQLNQLLSIAGNEQTRNREIFENQVLDLEQSKDANYTGAAYNAARGLVNILPDETLFAGDKMGGLLSLGAPGIGAPGMSNNPAAAFNANQVLAESPGLSNPVYHDPRLKSPKAKLAAGQRIY